MASDEEVDDSFAAGMPTIKEVCSKFGLIDVDLDYSGSNYQNLTTYKLFQQHVQSRLAKENPKVPKSKLMMLVAAKWREFSTDKQNSSCITMKAKLEVVHDDEEEDKEEESRNRKKGSSRTKKVSKKTTKTPALKIKLEKLERAISVGNIDSFKNLSSFIGETCDDDTDNSIESTNLVILACKYNKVEILKYIFNNTEILDNLSIDIAPDGDDRTCYNAFYYAIRSSNIELLGTLIDKWPGDYFATHLKELDEVLSKAYEELKLKNVLLSDEIEIFVEKKLVNFRFFSNDSGEVQNVTASFSNIKDRIGIVLENITLLNSKEEVDERFLYIAKFVAQNIHILKRQLKSTYNSLPWEEIEFCLVSFVSSHIKQQEINVFYQSTLNKSKILNHLEHFAKKLEDKKNNIEDMNISKLADLPKLKREKVIANIISNYPQFEELYNDHQQIRDIHSLDKISNYIKLALSADPKEREGQLIITRALQVIGENLKNTLESPKLSNTTSELLLLSLPKNTREVIIGLRNSLSHAYSLSKRTEIEENADVNFFSGIQNDVKKIDNVITDIFYNNKIKVIRILLKEIINSESVDEIKQIAKALNNVEFDKTISINFTTMEHEKLEKLIKELGNSVTEKTSYEEELFNKINNVINFEKTKLANISTDYIMRFASLKSISVVFSKFSNKFNNSNVIRGMKFYAKKTLESFTEKIEPQTLKEIAILSTKISHSIILRTQHDNLDEIMRLICEIFYIVEFGTGNIKWIEELREKLNAKELRIFERNQRKTYSVTTEKYKDQLTLKLSELKSILSSNALSNQLIETFPSYKSNKKLQAVIEMLVLDITSILGSSKNYLTNNLLFLDDTSPLLMGKCLRNHLAHDNALIDVLPSDPSISVILNAEKFTAQNMTRNKKKIGKLVKDDPSTLKNKFDQGLVTIVNQKRMFIALEEGNLEGLKSCLKKGADIKARSINLWTTLHFAAKASNLEIIKFILDQNVNVNVKDINGQSPLHIAVAFGRTSIVEFLIEEVGICVGDVDNYGETPLHIAAQIGHNDTVKVLLRNKANTFTKNQCGFPPLHYAIRNNHFDVAKVLLEKDANVDINEAMGGYTSLHVAAEEGYSKLVNFLLQNKANVNAKNDTGWTPLHAAAFNGHLEVVNVLILNGAEVNVRVVNGCSPLHYAIENDHEKIVDVLLGHGANVNVVDKTYNNTPLHYAALNGHEGILMTLLKNNANANVVTVEGITPLHFAAWKGHLGIVAALLKHGVDIHAKNRNYSTPLHFAAESGFKEIVDFLIKNKARVNVQDIIGKTPLHEAALKGHGCIIDLLIENKARVNAQDIEGSTALHAAARNGSTDVIDLLIKNSAEVDARTKAGVTPLYAAALNGHRDAIAFLIKSNAEVNAKANCGMTPLHAAIMGGHKDVVTFLIKNKAQVNARGVADKMPLHMAVEAGHKEVVEILMANGANINAKSNNFTPLLSAVKCNNLVIVEVLIANGANVNAEGSEPLTLAVLAGYRDIVEVLLKSKAHINMKDVENVTLLHLAAKRGHKGIIHTLIAKGADVNAESINKATPLYIAAQEGHEEVVEILIANGANVNAVSIEGAPLHLAAGQGHNNVVEVLVTKGAKIDVKDNKNRTPVELAVARGHLQVVKTLLQYKKALNAKSNDGWTVLHIAAQESNLEIVQYLIDKGCDIHAKNAYGSKPIHIAAREGYKDSVEVFLSKGSSINDLGAANQTLLHYAAIQGQLEVVKYLIAQGADVNVKDANGQTPVHIAANFGYKDVIKVLLRNCAIYNAIDKLNRDPLQMAEDKDVINLLASTEKLFASVKHNNSFEVKNYIKAGASVNAKNTNNVTPLHYAAWKGYDGVVNVLLQNKGNPNATGNKGFTALHYATKFSHLKVVNALLSHGAIFNAASDSGKTPLDFAVDKSITSLLKLVSESFKSVKAGNSKVMNDLNKIKDVDTVKAIMGACNSENKTLIVAAVNNNFPKVEQLKQILQDDVSSKIDEALLFTTRGDIQRALSIFKSVLEKRKEILGPDNPGTLDIQTYIAQALYKQGGYSDALNMLEEIFQKQKEMLGLNAKDTLSTRSTIALVLHRQGRDEEACNIYRDVCHRQKEILGSTHSDTLNTKLHMALVLERLGKYEEALNLNREVFEVRKQTLGAIHPAVLSAQNNIALVLASQGKNEEALKAYKEVFEKKKLVLGINHSDTLRTLHNIAGILSKQENYPEALKAHQEVLSIQKNILGPNHPDTLNSQYNIGNILFAQRKWIGALKAYKENFDQRKAVFGVSHPSVLDILKKLERINLIFKLQETDESEILQHLQTDISIAANNGDIRTVQSLLKNGADVNDKDTEGRTPLHYAINNGHTSVVSILLENGADATQVTNKGNTPLHTAVSKGYKEIVEILLQSVKGDKLNGFINAKTVTGATTSLHVAAKNGFLEIVKSLLKQGATYNIENKERKIPSDLSKDQNVTDLLKLVEELFEGVRNGNIEVISKLKAIKGDEFTAITNTDS